MLKDAFDPSPCLFAVTPYTVHRNHPRAMYFAARAYVFLIVDARGRGNSEGTFRPFIQEAKDGYDIVEWIARQPFCNGKVGAFSGSYEGYSQWATAKEFPPHLTTIVPGMAAAPGVDFPMRNNIPYSYVMQWLTFTAGVASQDRIFDDQPFWRDRFRQWYVSGRPFKELDSMVGNESAVFQEWLLHPELDPYWDAFRPTASDYAKLDLPILTLTGSYDDDQPGALAFYREHLRSASPSAIAKHYLVIGPWDHIGTLAPKREFGGLKVGPAAIVDMLKLHLDWYDWILGNGSKPRFLEQPVAYYVMGAEIWRYAGTLDEVTSHWQPLYLRSTSNPTDVFRSGVLSCEAPGEVSESDSYVYDPRDVSHAELESHVDPEDYAEQRMVHVHVGKQLVYHTRPFERDIEISGFFRLSAWISLDQPDTDFRVAVYEIAIDGTSIRLSTDSMRARYRDSFREQTLVCSQEPLRYDFERFTFISRRIRRGSRLRLVIGPIHSIYNQRTTIAAGWCRRNPWKMPAV
jgi:putative CocE/NonD family hydrolase